MDPFSYFVRDLVPPLKARGRADGLTRWNFVIAELLLPSSRLCRWRIDLNTMGRIIGSSWSGVQARWECWRESWAMGRRGIVIGWRGSETLFEMEEGRNSMGLCQENVEGFTEVYSAELECLAFQAAWTCCEAVWVRVTLFYPAQY